MQITVIGAGVLGLSSALALAERGHSVKVIEKGQPGIGASGKAAGIVSTMTWHDDEFRLIQETRGRIGELVSLAMIEGDPAARSVWKPYDSIVVAAGKGLGALDEMEKRLDHLGEEPERFAFREAAAQFPGVQFSPGEEVLVAQEDGAVEPNDLVQLLAGRLANEDVDIVSGSEVTERPKDAEAVVVAGGAWTAGLLAKWNHPIAAKAYRTQLTSLGLEDATSLPMVHDLVHGFYTRPESEGSMMAGNGTQLRPFDPNHFDEAADPEFVQSIAERMVTRFDRGGDALLRRGWAGLCVGTPDRRALCGGVPETDDLFVLTGDNGFGVMRCLALGERLADAVEGEQDAGLDPGRFNGELEFTLKEGYGWEDA